MIVLIRVFTLFLVLLLLSIGLIVSKKLRFDKNKSSPFECGFSPKFNYRIPFSIRFYLISIVFLIFDVELMLLFPMVIRSYSILRNRTVITFAIFILVLILGLYHECNQGSLN